MAGATMTFTETTIGPVRRIKAAWLSDDTTGAVSGTTTYGYNGKCELLTTVPSGGGTAPTDNYDVAVTDADSVDVLAGAGANRDTANTEQVVASSLGAVATSKLTVAITNAGNAKAGTVYLDVR